MLDRLVSRKMSGEVVVLDTLNLFEPEIAFSFEREGTDPTSLNNPKELNILAFYYPQGKMTEEQWFARLIGVPWSVTDESLGNLRLRHGVPEEVLQALGRIKGRTAAGERKFAFLCRDAIGQAAWETWEEEILECAHRGAKPTIPAEHWVRDPLTQDRWFDLLDACDMYSARLYLYGQKIPWSALRKTSIAPSYLREKLLDEAGGKTWETTHAFKESSLVTIIGQVKYLEKVLGNYVLDLHWPDTGRSSYHIHLSFRRPKNLSEKARLRWALNLGYLAYHLNNYAILKMFEVCDINNDLLAPYRQENLVPLIKILGKGTVTRDADGLEETFGSTNLGIYKSAATALRHCYKSETTLPDFDLEIFGFEFRAWQSLQDMVPHVASVERFLRKSDLCLKGDTRIDLGGIGERYTLASLKSFRYLSAGTAQWLKKYHPKAAAAILEAVGYELNTQEEVDCEDLSLKLMLPFLDWASHPAIPSSVGARLTEERQRIARELENLFDAMVKSNAEEPLSGEEAAIVQEIEERGPFRYIEKRVHAWGQRNQVWKYF